VPKKEFIVDGGKFNTLTEAANVFSGSLGFTDSWKGNLDAFNDMLSGGFGTPDEGFVLIWHRSDLSRERLGFKETLRWLEERVKSCHPSNAQNCKQRIAAATENKGETLFDKLVEIIRGHKDIELRLE
jgi:RNAse (barnase) inhibitor barstar